MGWTETFGTGSFCILWWLFCVVVVHRGEEGNEGKKTGGMGERRKGLPLPSPFRSLSRFSPPPLPSPPLPSSWEIGGIGHFHEQSFWLKHVQFKHFLGSTGKVSSPYKPDILTQTYGPRVKKADCPPGQTSSVYCIGRQCLTLKVIVQLFELTEGLNSLLVC